MKKIEVKKENAVMAYKKADASGKELLKNLFGSDIVSDKITDRVKDFEDVLEELGNPNFSDTGTKDEVAYAKIKLIAKALNEGWTPNWDDSKEYKYYPYFNMASGVGFSDSYYDYWYSASTVGSRLCFKSSELATYAGKQFESIYKDFLTL